MKLIILTGPPGAGKNTISEELAKADKRLAVIDVDVVRWMVRQPHKAPWDGLEGEKQQILGVENTCALAQGFLNEGYDVVILDVLSKKTAGLYREKLKSFRPKIALLIPSFEEIKKRNMARPPRLQASEIESLYRQQSDFDAFDVRIDNTIFDPIEVAKKLSEL